MAKLLWILELGGYPDFSALYKEAGFEVLKATSMRKAISLLKKEHPQVVVCEFNFQSDFRDRTSSLESLLATLQGKAAETKLLVFYEEEYAPQFARLQQNHTIHKALAFPIEAAALRQALAELVSD